MSDVYESVSGANVTYKYDKIGNVTTEWLGLLGSEVKNVYEYNESNLLKKLTQTNGNTAIGSYEYTYYMDGNIAGINENSGERIINYEYDNTGRLKKEGYTQNGTASEKTYTYDAFGNRASMNNGGVVTNYTYDRNNRLLKQETETEEKKQVYDYTYDRNGNRLSVMKGEFTKIQLPGVTADIDSIENNDTMEQYEYNLNNRLKKVVKNGNVAEYTYDAFGNQPRATR